jgi:hypothetical protein
MAVDINNINLPLKEILKTTGYYSSSEASSMPVNEVIIKSVDNSQSDGSQNVSKITEIDDVNTSTSTTFSSTKITNDFAKKEYVAEQISKSVHLTKEIVTEVPSIANAKENVIYLIKDTSATGDDKYKEYQLINEEVVQTGDTSIDLSGYAKETYVDEKVTHAFDFLTEEQKLELKGDKGDKGEQGIQGIQGEKGDKGEQGIQGEKGDKGDKGEQGIQGEAGKNGTNGVTPTIKVSAGSNINTVGTPSVTASTSGTTTTFTFNNLKGAKGDKGDTGSNGTNGTTPTIKVASGSNIGSVGTPSVSASTSGTTTTFTFNYLKGAKGDKGDSGSNGTTPTIKASAGSNIGSVGTPSVTATTSGTTTTFTFNNLKGAKGDKGDTGATGSKGATGATGATPMIHVNGMGGGERTMAELGPQEGIIAICTNVSGGSFFTSVTDGTVKCNGSSFTSGKTPTAGQSYVIVNSSATASARIYCKNNGGSAWTIIGDVL